jgi:hypothetical protein
MTILFGFGLEIVRVIRQIRERNLQLRGREMARKMRMKATSRVSKEVEDSAEGAMTTTALHGIQMAEAIHRWTTLYLDWAGLLVHLRQ